MSKNIQQNINNPDLELENFDGTEKLTLDTHVLIWYMEGIKLSQNQVHLIDKAKENNNLFVSAISIWEVAMLANKGKVAFSIGVSEWIEKALSIPGLNLVDLSAFILIESTSLPNYEHKDPADRMIISTCRSNGSHLMTFDQKIIDYSNNGYLKIVSIDY
ncbi:MAG UNVERIFIED_CONTAM: type II toxin-antitoxin system VapC family toxin [Rickettsiaceae bacterium]|jgi:PIN domain nuclease of toxin-antitoxin system